MSHGTREALDGHEPVHVTLNILDHVYSLRSRRCFAVIQAAFAAVAARADIRIVGLNIQERHLHLLVEAASAEALSRGMQALKIRLAQGLNRLMGRHGTVFAERYHQRVLRTPAQVAFTQAYVLNNTAKHAAEIGRALPAGYRDPFAIGYFGGEVRLPVGTAGMVKPPATWLLAASWRRGQGGARTPPARNSAAPSPQLSLFEAPGPVGRRAEATSRAA